MVIIKQYIYKNDQLSQFSETKKKCDKLSDYLSIYECNYS